MSATLTNLICASKMIKRFKGRNLLANSLCKRDLHYRVRPTLQLEWTTVQGASCTCFCAPRSALVCQRLSSTQPLFC